MSPGSRWPHAPWRIEDGYLGEMADVITAAAAMSAITDGGIGQVRDHFEQRLAAIMACARLS